MSSPARSDSVPPCCSPSLPPDSAGSSHRHGYQVQSNMRNAQSREDHDPARFATIPAGEFLMGTNDGEGFPADGEGPARVTYTEQFLIDRYATTNADFSRFVTETGYVSESERFGWSFVFQLFVSRLAQKRQEVRRVPGLQWWLAVDKACWKRPEGRGSDIKARMDHPVVHVSWNDASAYCEWANCRLPTEVEWERAARGGLVGKQYPWGDDLTPDGRHMCNIWQGLFPTNNTQDDGWAATCPVSEFPPNDYGLFNMSGNVWEWCANLWTGSANPTQPHGPAPERVMRGGSYLCHHSYCNRYRVAARSKNTPDSATGNLGFRVARDAVISSTAAQ